MLEWEMSWEAVGAGMYQRKKEGMRKYRECVERRGNSKQRKSR